MLKKPSSCIVPGLCHSRRACLSQHSNYGSSNWYARDKIRLFPHWRIGCLGHVSTGRYDGDTPTLALDGAYRIATTQGEVVCQPAFALYAALCRRYPPEVVEATCWIPRAQLVDTARLLWQARPVSYYAWSGHEHHANVTQTARDVAALCPHRLVRQA